MCRRHLHGTTLTTLVWIKFAKFKRALYFCRKFNVIMKKICLNDRVCATRKFLAGEISLVIDKVIDPTGKDSVKERGRYFDFSDGERVHCRFAVGDSVAVAMSYRDAGMSQEMFGDTPGWKDKSRVNPAYMPHRIVIERVRCVRIQDITEDEARRAGVVRNRFGYYMVGGDVGGTETDWTRAFGRLFNCKSKVPYGLNPWVIVYDVTPVIGRAEHVKGE